MEETISAAEANRQFSRLLREVGEGRSYVITSHGRPVARIQPFGDESKAEMRETAKAVLLSLLSENAPQGLGKWTRDELYDR